MRLTREEALARLADNHHGVFCTLHPERGVDAVPCIYSVHDGYVGVPTDRVKPKSTLRLQREVNLEADPRATLLIEQWDADDWSRLWWVRAELRREPEAATDERMEALAAGLAASYAQYRDRPFASIGVLRIVSVTGWAAAEA